MSNKYSRHQSIISRQSDENISEDHWLKNFQNSLQKGAVQPRNVDSSLFDQINSIMNGKTKSKYTSVEAAVEDMKARSGLTAYLDKVSKVDNTSNTKVASDEQPVANKKTNSTPIVFQKFPQIKKTLENYIKDTRGNLPVPAIIEKLRSIHNKDVSDAKDWDDNNLIKEVSRQNLMAKADNPSNFQNYDHLGSRDHDNDSEIDPSNTDAFHSLEPVKF